MNIITCFFDGNVTFDGALYIRLANLFNETHSFYYENLSYSGYFRGWPPLYTLSIAALNKIISCPAWVCSKIINLTSLLILFYFVYRYYGKQGWIIPFLFTGTIFIQIVSSTFSETMFISFIGIHVILIQKWWKTGKLNSIIIIITGIGMFYTRYIGILALPSLGILLALKYISNRNIDVKAIVSLVLILLGNAALIIINYVHQTTLLGNSRPPLEGIVQIFNEIYSAIMLFLQLWTPIGLLQWKWPMMVVIIIALCLVCYRYFKNKFNKAPVFIWLLYAGIYISVLFISKLTVAFHWVDTRLLFPFVFLIIMCLVEMMEKLIINKYILLTFCFFVLIYNTYVVLINYTIIKDKQRHFTKSYNEKLIRLQDKYSTIPLKSTVLLADAEMIFVRPDIQIRYPNKWPYYVKNQTYNDFINSYKKENVFVNVILAERAAIYDNSFVDIMNKHKSEVFFRP